MHYQKSFLREYTRTFTTLLTHLGLVILCSSAGAYEVGRPVSTHLEVRIAAGGGGPAGSGAASAVVAEWRAHLANPIRQPERLRGILSVASPVDVHRLADADDLPFTSDAQSINGRLGRYVFFDFTGMVEADALLRAVSSETEVESAYVSYGFPLTPDPLLGTPFGFDPPESWAVSNSTCNTLTRSWLRLLR